MSMNDELADWTEQGEDLIDLEKVYAWSERSDVDGGVELTGELESIVEEIGRMRGDLHRIVGGQKNLLLQITQRATSISRRVTDMMRLFVGDEAASTNGILTIGKMLDGTDQVAYFFVTMWNMIIKRILAEDTERGKMISDEIKTFIYVLFSLRDRLVAAGILEPLEIAIEEKEQE